MKIKFRTLFRVIAFVILPLVVVVLLYQNYLETRFSMKLPSEPVRVEGGGKKGVEWQVGWILRLSVSSKAGACEQLVQAFKKRGLPVFLGQTGLERWVGLGPEPSQEQAEKFLEVLKDLKDAGETGVIRKAQVQPFEPLNVVF